MTTIAAALQELRITEWTLRGEPQTEDEFNQMFRKVVAVDTNGSAIESSDPSKFGVTWHQVSTKRDELIAAEPLRLLREERNRLIKETDWWASSDLTMTDEQRAYRQTLRDITDTYKSLDEVVWPLKPSPT
jgi:hypothetical protein